MSLYYLAMVIDPFHSLAIDVTPFLDIIIKVRAHPCKGIGYTYPLRAC
jgi:hypothetical protein